MAVNDPATDYMPKDYFLAKTIGMELYQSGGGGIDIKTQVTMDDDKVIQVIVAIPLWECDDRGQVENIVHKIAGDVPEIIINGTGRFVTHGPIGDCGTTGRKLAVDFYGGNCKIGGGSPWTKDASKADLTLNIYARYKALEYLKAHGLNVVYCSISCCIGRRKIRVSLFDQANQLFKTYCESPMPQELITKFHLREPRFARMCRDGLLVDL